MQEDGAILHASGLRYRKSTLNSSSSGRNAGQNTLIARMTQRSGLAATLERGLVLADNASRAGLLSEVTWRRRQNASASQEGCHRWRPHQRRVAVPSGIALEKLERIRQVMPADEFRHDWGGHLRHLLAAERARAITP